MNVRHLLLTILVAIPACAVNDQGWEMKPQAAPLPAFFVDSTAAQIALLCPPRPGYVTNGCAVRNYQRGVCYIYVEPDAPKWLATHEALHCAGFNHS